MYIPGTTGTVIVSTQQLPLISLNHSVYLEFVAEDSSIAERITLHECNGIFTGQVTFPGSLVFYQLRGHDIQGNPFAHVILNSERRFRSPSFALDLANYDAMLVNPGTSSFHKLWLQYSASFGPTLMPIFQSDEPQGISLQYRQYPTTISPGERQVVVVELTVANGSVVVGDNLTLTINITDNCTDVVTTFSYSVIVSQPLQLSVVNSTSSRGEYTLTVTWNRPNAMNVHRYRLILDYDNGTVTTENLSPRTLTYITNGLAPYQRVFISLAAINSTGNIMGFSAPKPFRSAEGK